MLLLGVTIVSACGGGDGGESPSNTNQQQNQQAQQPTNQRPVANAGEDADVNSEQPVTLNGSGSDQESGTLSYSWSQTDEGPRVALSNANTERPSFNAPAVSENTTLKFVLTVTDAGGLTGTDEVSINVNAPPTAVAGEEQNAIPGNTVTLNGTASSDPSDGTLSYSWRQASGGPRVALINADTATATFVPPIVVEDTDLTFELTVTDDGGLTRTDTVDVAVPTVEAVSIGSHDGSIRSVSVSRDGNLAVSGGTDGTVRLWDIIAGTEMRFADAGSPGGAHSLGAHEGAVYAVAISADGRRVISGGVDGFVRLWDTTNGVEIRFQAQGSQTRSLGRQGIWVYALALNNDGTLAVSGGFDGEVRLWNTDAGTEITYATSNAAGRRSLGSHGYNSVFAVSISDDGRRVLSGSSDGTVRVWQTIDGVQERTLSDDDAMGPIYGVVLSGDGSIAVSGSADNNVHVWNANNGIELYELVGHGTDVSSVSLNADKTRVLSADGAGYVHFWNVDGNDPDSGDKIHSLRRHTDYVWSAALRGDGRLALSSSGDGLLNLWNTATTPRDTAEAFATAEIDIWPPEVGSEHDSFTTPEPLLPGQEGNDGAAWVLSDIRTGGHTGVVSGTALSANGRLALSGSYDGTVRLWNTADGTLLRSMTGHANWIHDVALSPDGRWAVSGGGDNQLITGVGDNAVRFWDMANGTLLHTMYYHIDDVIDVSLSSDGSWAASVGWDDAAVLWDTTTGRNPGPGITNTAGTFSSGQLGPDGDFGVSGSFEGDVRITNTENGEIRHIMFGHTDTVSSVALSADGRFALSGSWDATVRLWDVANGLHLRTMVGHTDRVNSVALSADGRLALSGSRDGGIHLWDATTGKILRAGRVRVLGVALPVNSVSLGANGHVALSSGLDPTAALILWRLGRSNAVP